MLDKIQFAIAIIYAVLTLALSLARYFEQKNNGPGIISLILLILWSVAVGFIICLALLAELRLI